MIFSTAKVTNWMKCWMVQLRPVRIYNNRLTMACKKIFSSDSFESGINLEGMHVSSVLTYQEIKDDLYIYISVSGRYQGKKITLLVELVDDQNPRIIQQYDGYLNIISRTRDAQGNALAYFAVGNDLHKE